MSSRDSQSSLQPTASGTTAQLLRAHGYDVHTCARSEAFLIVDPAEQAACVLLDVRLPSGLSDPLEVAALLEAVRFALDRVSDDRAAQARCLQARERYSRLTARERQVFSHLISGQLNKQIAFDLGIAEPTVKIHRRRVLTKMEANSIADLVRLAADLGIPPQGTVR